MNSSGSFTVPVGPEPPYVLEAEIQVNFAWGPNEQKPSPSPIRTVGIWDTGATNTVFDYSLIEELRLVASGTTTARTPKGKRPAKVYVASVYLPKGIIIPRVVIIDGEVLRKDRKPDEHGSVLIGMDIISKGDLIFTNHQNNRKFTFRMPSKGHAALGL